jgi:predicted lactoylglutathione lyase
VKNIYKEKKMMPKNFGVNLPAEDVQKSKKFYTELGFSINIQEGNGAQVQLVVGENNAE